MDRLKIRALVEFSFSNYKKELLIYDCSDSERGLLILGKTLIKQLEENNFTPDEIWNIKQYINDRVYNDFVSFDDIYNAKVKAINQCTGLFDENNILIYEDDLIRHYTAFNKDKIFIYKVAFINAAFVVRHLDGSPFNFLGQVTRIEVVDNIHSQKYNKGVYINEKD